jgi:hypothetical protein
LDGTAVAIIFAHLNVQEIQEGPREVLP